MSHGRGARRRQAGIAAINRKNHRDINTDPEAIKARVIDIMNDDGARTFFERMEPLYPGDPMSAGRNKVMLWMHDTDPEGANRALERVTLMHPEVARPVGINKKGEMIFETLCPEGQR